MLMQASGGMANRLTVACRFLLNHFSLLPALDCALLLTMFYFSSGLKITWDFNLTLAAVDDKGGLKLDLNLRSKPTDNFHTNFIWNAISGDWDKTKTEDEFMRQSKILPQTIYDSNSKLQKDLNKVGRFVFPGSGIFAYKEPTFNYNGDILLTLTYDG